MYRRKKATPCYPKTGRNRQWLDNAVCDVQLRALLIKDSGESSVKIDFPQASFLVYQVRTHEAKKTGEPVFFALRTNYKNSLVAELPYSGFPSELSTYPP